jgi:hypothetical protein
MTERYFHSVSNHSDFLCELSAVGRNGMPRKRLRPEDCAIDSALRCVPLPAGMMTRLGKLAYTISDEIADQFDCLGC